MSFKVTIVWSKILIYSSSNLDADWLISKNVVQKTREGEINPWFSKSSCTVGFDRV